MRKVVYSIQTPKGHDPRGYLDDMEERDVDEFVRSVMKPGDKWVVRVPDEFYATCRAADMPTFQKLVMGLWDGDVLVTRTTSPGPRKPVPQLPPETWATPRKDVDYMAEVRAMCGGAR